MKLKKRRPTLYKPKECQTCGELFRPIVYFNKYCTDYCRYLNRKRYGFIAPKDMKECASCGTTENLTVNHIKPRVIGIDNDPTNLEVLCFKCNCQAYSAISKEAIKFYFESKKEAEENEALSDIYESWKEEHYGIF